MSKYFKTAYQFGSLGGILSLFAFFILSFFYVDPTNLTLLFGYVITPIAIFLAIKFFKEYSNGGYLSFAEGMSVGFVTYVLIGLVSAIGIWIILTISPSLFEQIKLSKFDVLEKGKETIISQVGENSFDATLVSIKEMSKLDVSINDGLWKIIPGLFFTIIISIILRKNPN
ncbi:DUF4199 domain-containing protein [Algoriphagus marinus]|jgi:hypothetical protein|uniref:DUF4199 domain-containing protein n=1 Tax=Algoriphagus marinus TaxID=1925762 RepID=UPI00094BA2A8|nr:DUF4199 domain-containing protein [Algoriphagus marinus]